MNNTAASDANNNDAGVVALAFYQASTRTHSPPRAKPSLSELLVKFNIDTGGINADDLLCDNHLAEQDLDAIRHHCEKTAELTACTLKDIMDSTHKAMHDHDQGHVSACTTSSSRSCSINTVLGSQSLVLAGISRAVQEDFEKMANLYAVNYCIVSRLAFEGDGDQQHLPRPQTRGHPVAFPRMIEYCPDMFFASTDRFVRWMLGQSCEHVASMLRYEARDKDKAVVLEQHGQAVQSVLLGLLASGRKYLEDLMVPQLAEALVQVMYRYGDRALDSDDWRMLIQGYGCWHLFNDAMERRRYWEAQERERDQ